LAKHRLNEVKDMVARLGSGESVRDNSGHSSDMLAHFLGGSIVVQHGEELGAGAKVVSESEERWQQRKGWL
jgi:hypothetical protein